MEDGGKCIRWQNRDNSDILINGQLSIDGAASKEIATNIVYKILLRHIPTLI